MKPVGRVELVTVALVALLLFAGFEVQKHLEGPSSAQAQTVTFSPASPEMLLTSIQPAQRPDHVDSTLKRFASLLDILAADCPANTRRGLADLTVASIRKLRHAGIEATPTEVLGGVVGATGIGATAQCSGFFRRYATERRTRAERQLTRRDVQAVARLPAASVAVMHQRRLPALLAWMTTV